MICDNIYKYCNDDISKIENYEIALNDNTQVWDCHHKLEIDLNLSKQELIDKDLYFNRPANELILLTHSEHIRLHKFGSIDSEVTKQRKRIAMIGKNLGKHHTEETKQIFSEQRKGENHPLYGKHHAEKTKNKISESLKGKQQSQETINKRIEKLKGRHRVYREDGTFYMSY